MKIETKYVEYIPILDIVYKSNIEHSCNTLKKQTNIKKLVL